MQRKIKKHALAVPLSIVSCITNRTIQKTNHLKDEQQSLETEQLWRKAKAMADDIIALESIDTAVAYGRVRAELRRRKMHVWRQRVTRYAAILTLPLLFSTIALGYLLGNRPTDDGRMTEIHSSKGAILRYELPDKSVVWLNSGSRLRFPAHFAKANRLVELQGEGYFEVKADPQSPFYVNTSHGLQVYVYGTHFNVSAYEESDCIETVLEEGHVNVVVPNRKTQYTMEQGEILSYNKQTGQITSRRVDTAEKVAWKEGKLVFRDMPLEEIFQHLERHFNIDITFVNHSGKQYRYRATFYDETLPQIMDYLGKSAALSWHFEKPAPAAGAKPSRRRVRVDLY